MGLIGLPNHGSTSTTLPPGRPDLDGRVAEPREAWCRDRSPSMTSRRAGGARGVSRCSTAALSAVRSGSARRAGLHSRRARRADRLEPRADQLDRADRPRGRLPSRGRGGARCAPPATKGYLAFTAFCAAAFGGLAYLSDTGAAGHRAGSPVTADPAYDAPRRRGARRLRRRSPWSRRSSLAPRRTRRRPGPAGAGSRAARRCCWAALTWGGDADRRGDAHAPARRAGAWRRAACSPR